VSKSWIVFISSWAMYTVWGRDKLAEDIIADSANEQRRMTKGFEVGIWPSHKVKREIFCIVGRTEAFIYSATTFDDLRKKPIDKSPPFGVLAMLLNVGNNEETA